MKIYYKTRPKGPMVPKRVGETTNLDLGCLGVFKDKVFNTRKEGLKEEITPDLDGDISFPNGKGYWNTFIKDGKIQKCSFFAEPDKLEWEYICKDGEIIRIKKYEDSKLIGSIKKVDK